MGFSAPAFLPSCIGGEHEDACPAAGGVGDDGATFHRQNKGTVTVVGSCSLEVYYNFYFFATTAFLTIIIIIIILDLSPA